MKKVLIIEDEHQLRDNIVELFEADGYTALAAENGSLGFEEALRTVPDLIVSDVIMPELDGFGLLRKVRENPVTELIPVVLLTAKNMLDAKLEGLEEGADDYIAKPFDARELLLRARNLIEKHDKLLKRGLLQTKEEDFVPKKEKMVREIIQYIDENLSDYNLSVEMVANHMQLSKSTIQRKLKAAVDKNLNQLIREYRLERARKMIEKDTGSLSAIAQATGFNSLSYFSYSYKKFYGVSPSRLKH